MFGIKIFVFFLYSIVWYLFYADWFKLLYEWPFYYISALFSSSSKDLLYGNREQEIERENEKKESDALQLRDADRLIEYKNMIVFFAYEAIL